MTVNQPTDGELQEHWDDAIAKWQAGGEHPLARHPLAVRCDGYPGCFTIAPIRMVPNYSKRYCADHLPKTQQEAKVTCDDLIAEIRKDAPGRVTVVSYDGLLFALQCGIDVWEFAETYTLQAVVRNHGTPAQKQRLKEELIASRWSTEIIRAAALNGGDMSELPLTAEFFTNISYEKSEPRIAIVPIGMPNYAGAISISENPEAQHEGRITLADQRGEIMGLGIRQFGFESSVPIAAAYERLEATYGAEFQRFLAVATHGAIEKRWSEFPMYFPIFR